MNEKEIMEQLQFIASNMATKDDLKAVREELKGDIDAVREELKGDITALREEMHSEISASETRTRIFIENSVTRRIDSLFDGYKLNHEKQWELEHRVEELERIVEELRARIA